MTTIYCFVNTIEGSPGGSVFSHYVVAVAVCGACGDIITSHMSSNERWAQHDIQRPFHVERCALHAKQRHGSDNVEMVWLDHPEQSEELRALEGKITP